MHGRTNEEAYLVTLPSHSRVIVVLRSHASITIMCVRCQRTACYAPHIWLTTPGQNNVTCETLHGTRRSGTCFLCLFPCLWSPKKYRQLDHHGWWYISLQGWYRRSRIYSLNLWCLFSTLFFQAGGEEYTISYTKSWFFPTGYIFNQGSRGAESWKEQDRERVVWNSTTHGKLPG